ncbi:uncharacterized protein MYCFIDRAFT_83539 [Pseudocercospora fijiensis CIRAD86]|uniref:Bacteriophage T5 Orf172 DNA-binding domain-containing protein n=1 Tax=Pseudocercospora fijiensis (strain CIRAD86) TaxID=383855 RepID=M3AXM4_PSEFD|nr:uncharacterized protein MYCFIDRAFT_83539 [Pseudocercospora fijiensis CIRAD86]EME82212.1 hypothetical protein MYCFIDRAFT_83539 [Pseudocercospora fijiensis CIRAD86]
MANHFTSTPEALLGRNDSKNPSTTCKGLTSNGRPCRRALAAPRAASGRRRSSVSALNGVVALVEEDGEVAEADFYCWQHKDQAERLVAQEQNGAGKRASKKKSTELFPLQERSSIDTLVQKLGIEAVSEKGRKNRKTRPNGGMRPPKRTDTADFAHARPGDDRPASSQGFWASLCCAAADDEDYVEIVRHRKRMQENSRPQAVTTIPQTTASPQGRLSGAPMPTRKPVTSAPVRPKEQRVSSNPQTGHLLSLIPQHLSPQTTSILLSELIKPISPADEEGYIYIFWLTPESKAAPAESTARSLLIPPSDRPSNARRISDVMTEFSYDGSGARARSIDSGKNTIMLKIGRANNVTRRMNEWQRQCGYTLNLRRESGIVRKVPFVKRVERLIHLELANQQVKKQCLTCGKEHREWFEVEASQEGVKAVDQCVRRWVDWAEKEARK